LFIASFSLSEAAGNGGHGNSFNHRILPDILCLCKQNYKTFMFSEKKTRRRSGAPFKKAQS